MRIMLDTNVLISGLAFGGKVQDLLNNLIYGDHEICVSEYVVQEFKRIVCEKWEAKSDSLIAILENMPFTFCESTNQVFGDLRDKKDIPVLSDAIFHNVDILVSGDKDFLEAQITKPRILSPAECAEMLYMQKLT